MVRWVRWGESGVGAGLLATTGAGTTVASVGTPVAPDVPEPDVGLFTDLLPGEPDPSSFPRRSWAAAVRTVMHSSPDSVFGSGDRRGLAELRVALAGYLARSRSVVCDPARIVIFGGFTSALSTLSAASAALGITRVVEPVLDIRRVRRDAVSTVEQAALAALVDSGRLATSAPSDCTTAGDGMSWCSGWRAAPTCSTSPGCPPACT